MSASNCNKSLPRRFRRARLVIAGCGDVGLRLIDALRERHGDRVGVVASARRESQLAAIRARGARPLRCDLDLASDRARLASLGRYLLYLAPPGGAPGDDRLMRGFAAALASAAGRQRARGEREIFGASRAPALVYISTSGVYGDCGGALVDESRTLAPGSDRARSRVAAERQARALARRGAARTMILRVPGIYAAERLPLERIARGLPAIVADEDGYTNHIHADDLALICWLALFRGRSGRVYNASDSLHLKMGEWFDRLADSAGLSRPPRLSREQVRTGVSPMMWSFMRESRRLDNARLLRELRVRLRYPTVDALLGTIARRAGARPL